MLDGVDRHEAAVLARHRDHELAVEAVAMLWMPDGAVGVEQLGRRLVGSSGYPGRCVTRGTAPRPLTDPLYPSELRHRSPMSWRRLRAGRAYRRRRRPTVPAGLGCGAVGVRAEPVNGSINGRRSSSTGVCRTRTRRARAESRATLPASTAGSVSSPPAASARAPARSVARSSRTGAAPRPAPRAPAAARSAPASAKSASSFEERCARLSACSACSIGP